MCVHICTHIFDSQLLCLYAHVFTFVSLHAQLYTYFHFYVPSCLYMHVKYLWPYSRPPLRGGGDSRIYGILVIGAEGDVMHAMEVWVFTPAVRRLVRTVELTPCNKDRYDVVSETVVLMVMMMVPMAMGVRSEIK